MEDDEAESDDGEEYMDDDENEDEDDDDDDDFGDITEGDFAGEETFVKQPMTAAQRTPPLTKGFLAASIALTAASFASTAASRYSPNVSATGIGGTQASTTAAAAAAAAGRPHAERRHRRLHSYYRLTC